MLTMFVLGGFSETEYHWFTFTLTPIHYKHGPPLTTYSMGLLKHVKGSGTCWCWYSPPASQYASGFPQFHGSSALSWPKTEKSLNLHFNWTHIGRGHRHRNRFKPIDLLSSHTSVSTFFLSSRSRRSWSAFWSRLNFSSSWARVAARLLASSFRRWYCLTWGIHINVTSCTGIKAWYLPKKTT